MKKSIRCLCFGFVILMMAAWSVTALAANEQPDFSVSGSISVTVRDTQSGEAVSGGELTCYEVAKLTLRDGEYILEFTEDFRDCGKSLENLESAGLANALAAFAGERNLSGKTQKIEAGTPAFFDELELGLYLVKQTADTADYSVMNPFLVTVPFTEKDGHLNYDLRALPKTGVETAERTTPTPPPTTPPTTPPKLPQTGQLWWPVPVLAGIGLVCIFFGVLMRKTDGEE